MLNHAQCKYVNKQTHKDIKTNHKIYIKIIKYIQATNIQLIWNNVENKLNKLNKQINSRAHIIVKRWLRLAVKEKQNGIFTSI